VNAGGEPPASRRRVSCEEDMTGQADSERTMKMARRWFAEGWAGNIALADDIFSEGVRTNGVAVGMAGPKGRIQERLAGFPDLSVDIEDMFSADDKINTRLVGAGLILAHMRASRLPASGCRFRTLPSRVSKAAKWLKYQRYRISWLC
jgi:hypothetical protein